MKLTDKIVAALTLRAPERERLIADDDMTGLRLRIRAGAKGVTKRWVYKYSRGGTQHSFTLDYPGHGLTSARKRAGELQARLRLGQDPAQDRREGKARALETMDAVLPAYLAHKRQMVRPRSYAELERHLTVYYQPLHRHPLPAITPAMVSARCAAITAASGATTAKNSWRSAHAFFFWAVRQGLMERNPAVGVEHAPDRKRDRLLTATEIRAVWQATAGDGDFNTIVRLLLLTGCRASEIGGLRWSEVYSDRLVLAAERVKNNRAHTVPLTPAVRAILEARPRHTISDHIFGREQLGFTGWSSSKMELDKRIKAAGTELSRWTLHDLRRTFATGTCELGISPHVVEAALNHVSGFRHGVAGVYNLAALEGPIRHALATWETHVLAIVEGRIHGDRVVPLRA
jgi:integrase